MDVRDRRQEAQGIDPTRVRKARTAVDQRQCRDGRAVLTEKLEGLVRAIDVGRADERCVRVLHLDDDREDGQRIGLEPGPQRGIDLVLRERFRQGRRPRDRERECEHEDYAADRDQPCAPHA
jgi:hypothetical protein